MHYSDGASGVGSNSLSAFTHGRGSVLALATEYSGIPEVVVKSWYLPYIFFKQYNPIFFILYIFLSLEDK